MASEKQVKKIPNPIKFTIGGLSGGMATCFVQPLDLVKTRMQTAKPGEFRSTVHCIQSIISSNGLRGFYTGLSAGLLRQATYTTTRMGVFNTLLDRNQGTVTFAEKAAYGMTAGALGSIVGTPAEVCLIRMTSDGRLPVEQRRGYKNVGNALVRIVREEGVTTLWRGCLPTIGRAMVLNAAQLASYAQFKEMIKKQFGMADGIGLHFVASMGSGFVATVASMPVDIVKTRVQNMKISADGVPEYRGAVHCVTSIIKNEGVFSLWRGFLPYYFRLGPHTVLTFIFMEQLNSAYKAL